jgi:putative Flp pilus-assembly TadE/G-like protein
MTVFILAFAFPVLIGLAGLGVETGLWYAIKRQDQAAADAAAVSGAYERATGQTYSDICTLAKRDAASNGFAFQSYTCPSTSPGCTSPSSGQMCANNPPVLGANASDNKAVEVILSRQQSTYFANIFIPNVTITSRAVAKVNLAGIACAGALSTSAPKAVNFSGSSTIDFSGCGVFSNSSASNAINFQGNTTFTASWFQTVGNYNTNGNSLTLNAPTRLTDSSKVTDPYSCNPPAIGCAGTISYTLPSGSGSTAPQTGGTLQPGLYSGPMNFTSGTTYLCPGVYYIDGEDNSSDGAFEVSSGATLNMWKSGNPGSCPSSGSIDGVTIIATSKTGTKGGGLDISSGATVNLSAPTTSPTTGIPSGILFYQDPAHADTHVNGNGKEADSTITASGSTTLAGALYTPTTNVSFQGNSSSSCFIMIALTLTFTGDSTLSGNSSACSSAGVSGPTVVNIALTE